MTRRPPRRGPGRRRRREAPAGFTLAELMVVVAVLGVIFALGPKIMIDTFRFFRLTIARSEIQRDARASLDLMNRKMRQAEASSVVVTRLNANQPPYSKVVFNTVSASSVTFWQEGSKLYRQEGTNPAAVLAENLRYMAFTYGDTDNDNIMSVSVTFEKNIYSGKSKALQMAVEKVRLMNN